MVDSRKILYLGNLFLRKSQRYKGRMSQYLKIRHFSKSCSSNDALAADRLYVKYTDMRANYTGAHLDNSRKFDAELVENVILRMNTLLKYIVPSGTK